MQNLFRDIFPYKSRMQCMVPSSQYLDTDMDVAACFCLILNKRTASNKVHIIQRPIITENVKTTT